jgi:hypothetical protein
MDYNLLHKAGITVAPAASLQRLSGRDEHSLVADAQFLDPAKGDYRVKDGSPAVALGFVSFPMDQFGVRKPELRAIALCAGPARPAAGSRRTGRSGFDGVPLAGRDRPQHRR